MGSKKETNERPEHQVDATEQGGAKDRDKEAELREQMLRIAAEFDNYKKRARREMDTAEANGKASFAKEMLAVVDEFELAIVAASRSEDRDLAKGVEMVYANMVSTMKRMGLNEVDGKGSADPFRHEIVMTMESDKPDGAILEVVKRGYEFNGRLLRPASVIVSKRKENEDDKQRE